MPETQTLPPYPRGLDFEQVWAALMENRKLLEQYAREVKEAQMEASIKMQETDRQMQVTDRKIQETSEQIKETDRQMQETDRKIQETSDQIKDINKRFGEYSNRLGEIAEYMIAPNLVEKFQELGMDFLKANRNTTVSDRKNKISFEIDVFLENSNTAMLVEIKTKLISDHINAHITRMEKMRKYADLHGDKRKFLGAVAGAVITDDIKELALNSGFFVIEPSGETFNITLPEGGIKEW